MPHRLCTHPGCNQTVYVESTDRNPPRCERHKHTYTPKKVYHDHQWHRAQYFYSSATWKRLRAAYILQHPLCEMCEKAGLVTPGKEVDHIIEIQDGGSKTDPDNLQTLCTRCHRKKTADEKRKREQRKNQNGFKSLSDF